MKHYAGLDLSMETTQVCVVDQDGGKIFVTSVESTPEAIAQVLSGVGPIERTVIETGRMSSAICLGLRRLDVNVVCIDARQAHQSLKAMKANKTDPHDAAGLAQLARTGFYKEVHVKSASSQSVRSVIAARSHLVEARVRLDNTIRGLCVTFGIKVGPGQGKDFVVRAGAASMIPGLGKAVAALLAVREELVDQIKALDRLLNEIGRTSTACQILMSIPGVGVQTAAAFAAAVDDAERFKRSRAAGAYFGLVPRRYQSGEIDWVGRITKQGDAMVRKLLYEAANSILTRARKTFVLKNWALKIARRRGLRKARVALARRLAIIMHAMLRDGTLFKA
ncbi:MAG: IS110 family transposase [Pseudomonadota bacterium]